jgi:hypothetical protein
VLGRNAECRRLGHGERTQIGRLRRQQGDDAAVGMSEQMIFRLEHFEQLAGLSLEVDVLERWVRGIARTCGHDERVAVGERPLRRPARVAARAVDENEPRAGPRDLDVHLVL